MTPTVEETSVIRTYCFFVGNRQEAVCVRADKLCIKEDMLDKHYTLLKGGQKVGEFKNVAGWWIDEHAVPRATGVEQ